MTFRVPFCAGLVLCLAVALFVGQAFATSPVTLSPVAGAGPAISLADIRGRAHVVIFWRSDCAPCLIELHNYSALSEAARGALVTVALEPRAGARITLARFGVPEDHAFAAEGDAQTMLEAVSDGGRRLPLSIALDSQGRICARHVGLLGTDRARAWIRQCSR